MFQWKWKDVKFWNVIKCVKLQITQPKLHQIKDIGGVLESSGRADFKTVIGIPIWPRFDRENKETSWSISNEQYCISSHTLKPIYSLLVYLYVECWLNLSHPLMLASNCYPGTWVNFKGNKEIYHKVNLGQREHFCM